MLSAEPAWAGTDDQSIVQNLGAWQNGAFTPPLDGHDALIFRSSILLFF